MIQVILTHLGSTFGDLQASEIVGEAPELPKVGRPFAMLGAPVAKGASVMMAATASVQEVRHHPEEGSLEFWTSSSHYGLQILDMDTPSSKN